MDLDEIGLLAQQISFANEDHFHEIDKRKKFISIFDKYLSLVDTGLTMELYDSIVALGRSNPAALEKMVKELKEEGLLQD